ncbi:hypothetical protein ZWY2020_011735 [Hordeum vulgare]|nr:hypothetical protein ZWY2020_011735 [Hordeum vulgare]
MSLFCDCLDERRLVDLGFTGPKFTWNNRQVGDGLVRVRLDRVVANGEFLDLFNNYIVENVITTTSDHFAIVVKLSTLAKEMRATPVQQQFRFEAAWLRAPDYQEVMEKAWVEGQDSPMSLQSTCDKLRRLVGSLKRWSHDSFGSVHKGILK